MGDRLRLLLEAITDYAICMLEAGGHVSSWNPGAERFKGQRGSEVLGEQFSRFCTEEDRASGLPQRALRTAVREGRFENGGWRVRKDSGRWSPGSSTSRPWCVGWGTSRGSRSRPTSRSSRRRGCPFFPSWWSELVRAGPPRDRSQRAGRHAPGGTLTIGIPAEDASSDRPAGLKGSPYVRLSVIDPGEGMDEDTLAPAVDPFFTTRGPARELGSGSRW